MAEGFDARSYLSAFCAVAMELYPELDWRDVEPKLERSWKRYAGDGIRRWAEVRELARARWDTQSVV